ncbi:hypothetical protein DFQ04_1887 [Algoriphagus boseongensis]|uniref:Uncharacterized protein n=1 Tax=Algoriphagus boseongensis TaxID=1442587 RepID=A0A4R6T7M2_9BACT|nr:hypothetical protein [Algoriphagus boseongensis]TDQ17235.1 hypothetical protein DFQ04_1887 [Algoriphagus boseongensis]
MKIPISQKFTASFVIFGLVLTLISCVETVENQQTVYFNNFSKLDLSGFENGKLFIWRNDTIAGYYHNEEVAVTVQDLPAHNYIKITAEILIHDSWDGNPDDGISGPDYWYMGYGGDEIFRTTFSNSPCESTFCLYQSYPNTIFRQNVPKTGAIQTNLPGLCIFGAFPNYTTRYQVVELIEHSNPDVRVFMGAELKQVNNPDPICDESWSVASIRIEAIQTNK